MQLCAKLFSTAKKKVIEKINTLAKKGGKKKGKFHAHSFYSFFFFFLSLTLSGENNGWQ